MTLQEIEYTLYDIFGFDTTPDARTVARLRRFINQSYHSIMGQRGMSKLRRTVLQCQTVAGSPFMVLPQAATSLITLADRVNAMPLTEITLEDLRVTDPQLSAVSTNPNRYVILNFAAATSTDISVPTPLYASSDHPSDTTGMIHIEGVRAGGAPISRVGIPLNGLTPVDVTGWGDWILVTKFLVYPATGTGRGANSTITLRTGTGTGPILSAIPPSSNSARFTRIHLYPTPSGVQTLYADVELHVYDLVSVNDEPMLHEDFQWVLVAGAAELEYKRRGKMPEMGAERKRKQDGVDEMKLVLAKRTGVAGQRNRFSQLGPWFPAGT